MEKIYNNSVFETITYKGVEYKVRDFSLFNGEPFRFATTALWEALVPEDTDDPGYADDEAEAIDDTIFYFLNEEIFEASDAELLDYLHANLPEIFA